jgi:N-acetylglutamate synthase-like GNAT family acetyltransferase
MDIDLIHRFITGAYWAKGRSKEAVIQSMAHSKNFALLEEGVQVAFARVVSDCVVFAYIMDVFVVPEKRGMGYGKKIIESVLSDEDLSQVEQWYLKTRDAHELYRRFGFENLADPLMMMERINEK